VIESALGDPSTELRRYAMESLWQSDSPNRLSILGQVIYSEPDPELRLDAVRLLGSDPNSAARTLLNAARFDSDERVSRQAERLLGL